MLPFQSLEEAIDEIRFAKQNGAVGIFFRGIEGEYTLDHPYLFPVYEEAQKQNLSICVHTGCGVRAVLEMFDLSRNHTFGHTRVMPLLAFRDLVANKIPEQFPGLRFGFIEAAAGWVPFLLHIVRRLQKDKFRFGSNAELFREYRIFVACEADEDIPYLAKCMGEDHLLIGSDYPHSDPSREDQFVNVLNTREDLTPQLRQKIMIDNPRAFYSVKRRWSVGVLVPSLQYSILQGLVAVMMMKLKYSTVALLFAFNCLAGSRAAGQEVFIGNPGKSLNFFHFDLALERGFFKELGLDVKLINTKCDIAVTALLTGDLQATGCVGSASRFIASQNVPVRTVIWLFKKPTFYVVARPDIKSAADLRNKTIGISSFGSDTDLSMKIYAASGKLDPDKDMKRIVAGSTATRLQGLKAGSLDATTLSPPFNIYAEQMGLRVLAYVGDFLEFPQSGFTVSDATLKNKRDVIKRLLRGTLRGLQFTLKNRAETVRFIAKDYKLQEPVADKVYASLCRR